MRKVKVNPGILRWARKTAGLTLEDAAKALGIRKTRHAAAADRLKLMETGKESPTPRLLQKMAKRYARPLLVFYLSEIPRHEDCGEDFRTLPDSVGRRDVGLVDAVVRDLRARQIVIRSALEDDDEAEGLGFIGSMKQGSGVTAVADAIRDTLGFDRQIFRSRRPLQEAFSYLRDLAQDQGIFVVMADHLGSWHTRISVDAFRGLALADDVAPFIAVNANDSPGAWSFTLVHELAHLWINATGVSGGVVDVGQETERFCNDVASRFLVDDPEIDALRIDSGTSSEDAKRRIEECAAEWNVSRTLVAYRLHRAGAFGYETFDRLKTEFRNQFLSHKRAQRRGTTASGGPNYFVLRRQRAGKLLCQVVERLLYENNLSATKAAQVLAVGPHNVYPLLRHDGGPPVTGGIRA